MAGAIAHSLSHPLLWFVWRRLIPDYFAFVFTGELAVCVLESIVFFALARPVRLSKAVSAAFLANAASYAAGVLLNEVYPLRGLLG